MRFFTIGSAARNAARSSRAILFMTSSGALVEQWPWTGERITYAAAETEKTMRTYQKYAYRANKIEMSLIFDCCIRSIIV